MNPNNVSPESQPTPPSRPIANNLAPPEDALFMINPEPPKPADKKSVALVSAVSVIGVIVLLGLVVAVLIGSANSLADDYRRLGYAQLKKIDSPLNDLAPSAVLNKRNIDKPLQTITFSQQSLPSLGNVLVVGNLSPRYTQTSRLQSEINDHYQAITTYSQDLKGTIAFDDALQRIFDQEPNIVATVNPGDSFSIRSVSGSYRAFAKQINDQPAPKEISSLKSQLVAIYNHKADIYVAWATRLDAGNSGFAVSPQTDLLTQAAQVASLTDDQSYVSLLMPTYAKLVKAQKQLESSLAT